MPQEVTDRRPGPPRVLVVDDEPAITDFIQIGLSQEGFEVETAGDGRAALSVVDRFAPDVVVLEVMMPRMDGIALTRELAGDPRRGLAILSARDDTEDRIRGLDLGADDYLGKPFEFGELLARVRSVLRRRQPGQAAVVRAGPLELDRNTRRVCRAGQGVEVTAREFDLLAYLMEHQGEVLTRDRLLNAVWGLAFYGDENTLEVYVHYLRLKRGDTDRLLIQTVRGVGYRLAAD